VQSPEFEHQCHQKRKKKSVFGLAEWFKEKEHLPSKYEALSSSPITIKSPQKPKKT
jgi:hypothetical protein